MPVDYREFLTGKRIGASSQGFDASDVLSSLFPWQRDIVRWSLRLGCAAIFAECGLGKTAMQLAWADAVAKHTGRPVLILTPLAVAPQTIAEAWKFGVDAVQAKSQDRVHPNDAGVYVSNYQRLLKGHFDASVFAGVVLDESSILKSYMGKTKRTLIEAFAATPYRLCCTATPAPNDHTELGNHSEFLGVMDSSEMLSRWFINDQGQTGNYRLKGHAASDYWRWVASWACCVSRPSDLGYPDGGFALPDLNWHEHCVRPDLAARELIAEGGQRTFAPADELTATTLHQELRLTAGERAGVVAELVNASTEPWVVWCNTNYEADELRRRIPLAVEVRGSEQDDVKEAKLNGFSRGEFRVLITKPSIAGFGMNWQHCPNVAFVGLSYSFEQLYQAVRRTWRFGQTQPVHAHVVYAETEGNVLATVKKKMTEFAVMQQELIRATSDGGLDGAARRELIPSPRETATGDGWTLHLGDSCEVIHELPSESVDFTIFSPPFSSLYIYSESEADLGNSASDAEFLEHFGYLVPELLRVTVPGRLCVVHCKDLPCYRGRDGAAGLRDFPGDLIRLFERHGWQYHSRVTIWKDPVVEMQRTKTNGLLYKTLRRDSSQSRQGMADYLVVFRKWVDSAMLSARPVTHTTEDFPLETWQRYASPVWMDIDQMDTLNERQARESKDEKHLCPLQLGVIRRCVELWTNPGDLVLSPFAGIGSEGVGSLELGRRFVGIELKRSYWLAAQRYLAAAGCKQDLPFEGYLESSSEAA